MKSTPKSIAGLLGSASFAALAAVTAASAQAGPDGGRIQLAQAGAPGSTTEQQQKGQHQKGQQPGGGSQKPAQPQTRHTQPPPQARQQPQQQQPQSSPLFRQTQPTPQAQQHQQPSQHSRQPQQIQQPRVTAPTSEPRSNQRGGQPTMQQQPKVGSPTPPPTMQPKIVAPTAPTHQPKVFAPTGQTGKPSTVQRDDAAPFNKFRPRGDRPDSPAAPGVPGAPSAPAKGLFKNFGGGPQGPVFKKLDDIKSHRQERVEGGVKVLVQPDKRTIVRHGGHAFIRHDESARFARFGHVRTHSRPGGGNTTVVSRPGGVQIISMFDRKGNLIERRRRGPNGRETRLIDNRRIWGPGAKIALGLGLAGLTVALAPPVFAMPRHKYVVEYEDASPDDIYEALSAPPVERLDRIYSLDEVRYSVSLRDRMRRIDLDGIKFDFGSWEVTPDQYPKLERIARVMMRIIDRNPNEVFLIEGHTDAVGLDEDNLTLSDHRAEAVADVLTREFDVPPENLVTQGYGEQFLKVATEGPERANRRVAVRRVTPLIAKRDAGVERDGFVDRRDRDDDDRYRDSDRDDGPPRRGGDDRDDDPRYDDRPPRPGDRD